MLVVFAAAIAVAWPWPPTVRLFPMVIGAAGLVFAAATMLRELRAVRGKQWGGAAINRHEALRTANFFAWLAGAVAVTVLAGQHVALPLFIAAYLMVWGGYGWRLSLLYAAAALAFIVGMFDLVMHTTWYPALLFR